MSDGWEKLLPGLRRWEAARHIVCDGMLEAAVLPVLVELHEPVQAVDDLLLHGEGEERVLAPSPDLVVDDALLVHNTGVDQSKSRIPYRQGCGSGPFLTGSGSYKSKF